jgi:NADH:ubiquinone reductase (H+-translocating)
MKAKPKVIIIGGGFGGINAAKALRRTDVDLVVIDRSNHHLFQPLLYQVATAALSPGNIAMPIREILRDQQNTSVIMGEVITIDKERKEILMAHGEIAKYDYLIIAPGARHSYFGHPEWEPLAPGLKNLNDAIKIRENILLAFERAERSTSPEEVERLLRFVIIGGGPTGVELAGAIAEIAHKTLFRDFRNIKPDHSEILLFEGSHRLLHTFPEKLSAIAQRDLEKMGVKIATGTHVTKIDEDGVYIGEKFIPTCHIIWAAGNHASPLLKTLNCELDRASRAIVEKDLSIPGYPNVFVIGDAANVKGENGNPLPGIAPVAIQQGRYVAKIIDKNISPSEREPFSYWDKGTLATIGRAKAVGTVGKRLLSGLTAWFAWCLIHIFYLVSFPNRILVMIQWFFWYLSSERYVRLIKKPIFNENQKKNLKL